VYTDTSGCQARVAAGIQSYNIATSAGIYRHRQN
jgi:hypothetical protein